MVFVSHEEFAILGMKNMKDGDINDIAVDVMM
jgi:hypothetical protein